MGPFNVFFIAATSGGLGVAVLRVDLQAFLDYIEVASVSPEVQCLRVESKSVGFVFLVVRECVLALGVPSAALAEASQAEPDSIFRHSIFPLFF